jgi:hypothetical protein
VNDEPSVVAASVLVASLMLLVILVVLAFVFLLDPIP